MNASYPLSLKTLIPHLRPEAKLLLACIQPNQHEANQSHIRALIAQPIDWQYLMQVAEKHRVMPSLYRHLPITEPSLVPLEIRQELRRRFFKNAQRNLRLTQELLSLVEAFKNQDIAVIPYKGMVLAASTYGKISLRQVWDIDVLIRQQDVKKSRNYLLNAGFKLTESFDREQSFLHNGRDVELDLHWGLTPYYFPIELTFEKLWENRQEVSLNTATVKSFASEDLFLILCIQIAKDCWERQQHIENLAKVCDIAALIHTSPNLDWETLLAKGQQAGIYRLVLFGSCLAKSLFNAQIPEKVDTLIQQNPIILLLVQQVCKDLFGTLDDDFSDPRTAYSDFKSRARQLLFYLRLRERPADKLKHIWEIFKTLPILFLSK